jgi:hypothetical protein
MRGDIGIEQLHGCCGVWEIDGISMYRSAKPALLDILTEKDSDWNEKARSYEEVHTLDIPEASHLIFTQASRTTDPKGYGYRLMELITAERLGTVTRGEPKKNPNSRNYIHPFIWALDVAGIKAWAKREKVRI